MKNEVKIQEPGQKHIRPEDEEKTKEERNDEKDRFDTFIDLEADNAKIVQLKTEPVVLSSALPVAKL
jgi:hypothetical protein